MSKGRKPVVECTAGEWRALCQLARATVPPPYRYAWNFVHSTGVGKIGREGDAELSPRREALKENKTGRAIVRVAKGLSYGHTLLILIHEMAHALDSWSPAAQRGHHDVHFDIMHGQVYRSMMEAHTG